MFWFSEWDKLERDEQRTTLNVVLDDSKINENINLCIKHWAK